MCGNEADDDCNGELDDGRDCAPGSSADCYGGPEGTEGVGACSAGTKTCDEDGHGYAACTGDVTPSDEVCGNDLDDDCDGPVDEGCVCAPSSSAS